MSWKMMSKRITRKTWATLATALIMLVIVAIDALQQPVDRVDSPEGSRISRVVDGDTVELESGQKVRYIGIDTPETVDPRRPVGCFGKEASDKNKELVDGKDVRLVKDVSETDKYGRLLRYVYAGDLFVNEYLVREGYAKASSYPPDVKYRDLFREAEADARINKRGLWADDACGDDGK
ncbi:MAG: thermonuclease family protein [Candidatus Moraniibacteriota bacterium]